MSGRPLLNFPAFFAAAIQLRDAGLVPVNPAEVDMALGFNPGLSMEAQGWNREDCLQRDFGLVVTCDWIALLGGWETSDGVAREIRVAATQGIAPRSLEVILADPDRYG